MAINTAKPSGAQALDSALAKDHDGSIFDNLGGFLDGAASGPGAGILGHVLGGSRPQVEQKIAETSGLSLDKVAPLLITVAPLVMGALGKLRGTRTSMQRRSPTPWPRSERLRRTTTAATSDHPCSECSVA